MLNVLKHDSVTTVKFLQIYHQDLLAKLISPSNNPCNDQGTHDISILIVASHNFDRSAHKEYRHAHTHAYSVSPNRNT